MLSEKPRVLFLCTANTCRSQMAEGWMRRLSDGGIDVQSAGTTPGSINANAVSVMAEAGLDISHQEPEQVTEEMLKSTDWVVTLCDKAAESCPTVPSGVKVMHRPISDPAVIQGDPETVHSAYQDTRDQVQTIVEEIIDNVIDSKNMGVV